ncbi:hypothetical protein [Nocardia sp. NBC_01388]|uniref:hypothetical protein n=1 Tax=Nocardia sp. NBC_01388 TaxID=2903596 RepID=UPI00324EFFE5
MPDNIRQFRKLPVEIMAAEFTGLIEPAREILGWITMCGGTARFVGPGTPHELRREDEQFAAAFLVIDTLEGPHRADIGDWIIRGVAGEFYPCKADIFDRTYEAVDEESDA